MGFKFYSKGASTHFYACLILLGVLLGILVVNEATNDNKLPRRPEKVELDQPATLHTWVNDKDVTVSLKAGETIKILGMRSGLTYTPERVWAELEDGTRGYINCLDFDVKYEAQVSDKKNLKNVTVKEAKENTAVVELKNGTTDEIHYDDLYPIWPRKWDFKYLNSSYLSNSANSKSFRISDSFFNSSNAQ